MKNTQIPVRRLDVLPRPTLRRMPDCYQEGDPGWHLEQLPDIALDRDPFATTLWDELVRRNEDETS